MKKISSLSPEEFEIYVLNELKKSEYLTNLKFEHREIIKRDDGQYEIDVTVRFRFLGADYLVLIECKKHNSPIKRDVVQIMHSKLSSIGAQKGMIYATTSYQSGAILYAEKHGISLVSIYQDDIVHRVRNPFFQENKIKSYSNAIKFKNGSNYYDIATILFPGKVR